MQHRTLATRLLAVGLCAVVGCAGGAKSASHAYAPAAEAAAAPMADSHGTIATEPGETWKRSTIVPNSSRVMVGDREQLALRSMQTTVTIDGFRARVVIDYLYANELDRQLEGTFQLRLPEEASPFFFAFGETSYGARDPQVPAMTIATDAAPVREPRELMAERASAWQQPKEARIVPRDTAQIAYDQTVRRRVDPAIVEWAGAGVFSARVFPLAPRKLHRIVIGYDVDLVRVGDALEYRFDLPADVLASTIDISVPDGTLATATPAVASRRAQGRQLFHFAGTEERTIAVRTTSRGAPLIVGSDPAGAFFAAQAAPALPNIAGATSRSAVFLVDTSLSSNPDRFHIWLALLRGVLDNNRDTLAQFNVVFFSVDAHWYRPVAIANTPENVDELMTFANTLALEGATDLGAAFGELARTAPGSDVFLLSDGAATWGEGNVHALARTLRAGKATLFAYQTGLAGTDVAALAHLARETGGAVFSVTGAAEVTRASTAHRARPWQLVEARLAGATDVMIAGRPSALFPGQTVTVVGRGAIGKGATLELVVEQGGRRETVRTPLAAPLASPLTSRTYGQIATARLEELEDATTSVARAYASHFRITGRTSSLLMLETEDDYRRFDIKPDDDAYVVKATPAAALFEQQLGTMFDTLGDPKAQFLAHLARLEKHPTARFSPAGSYRALLAQLPASAFAVPSAPLATKLRDRRELPAPLLAMLAKHELDYDVVSADATGRRARGSAADALKSLSSLVEQSPGDAVLARDVGYSAMELGLRAQAYHLFRRVAEARPHEPQTYRAMAQALAAMDRPELAMAYFEIPLAGQWEARFGDLRTIVVLDYLRFLRGALRGQLAEPVRSYAQARLAALAKEARVDRADVVVTITWNTDNTDVDLHVIEPSGEECFYRHPRTRSGGELTQDVTQGYGPEMYVLRRAPAGTYNIFAHYFASDRNRASARTKVHVTIFENWGMPDERVTERVIALELGKQKHAIAQLTRRQATIAK
jgi:tetratricopeptide (TPR) repeat protein